MRKTHLQDTKHFGPTCQAGRAGAALAARGEHITVKFSEFKTSDSQCERCKSGKLFAMLQRKA
jgi:hypothetical protein